MHTAPSHSLFQIKKKMKSTSTQFNHLFALTQILFRQMTHAQDQDSKI